MTYPVGKIERNEHWPADLDARVAAEMRTRRSPEKRREEMFAKMRRVQRKKHRPRRSRQWDWVRQAYRVRKCFICREFGPCAHREPDVELAISLSGSEYANS